MSNAKLTQLGVEVLYNGPHARVTQAGAEVLFTLGEHSQAKAGYMAISGDLGMDHRRAFIGQASLAGDLDLGLFQEADGNVSLSGGLKSEVWSGRGSLWRNNISFTGGLTRQVSYLHSDAGTLQLVGELLPVLVFPIDVDGELGFSATLCRRVYLDRVYRRGNLTFTPSLVVSVSVGVEGTIPWAGDNELASDLPGGGAASTSGLLSLGGQALRSTSIGQSGALTASGSVNLGRVQEILGQVGFQGGVESGRYLSLEGILQLAGAFEAKARKVLSGIMQMAALRPLTLISTHLPGTLTSVGGVVSAFVQQIAGLLSLDGSVVRGASRSLEGGLSLSGAFSWVWSKALQGVWQAASELAKLPKKWVTGTIALSGQRDRTLSLYRSLVGELALAGQVVKQSTETLAGDVTFGGAFDWAWALALQGVVSFSGTLPRSVRHQVARALSFAGDNFPFASTFTRLALIMDPADSVTLTVNPTASISTTLTIDTDVTVTVSERS